MLAGWLTDWMTPGEMSTAAAAAAPWWHPGPGALQPPDLTPSWTAQAAPAQREGEFQVNNSNLAGRVSEN